MGKRPFSACLRLQAITTYLPTITLTLFFLALPLPRHWILIRRDFPGVYYEYTSLSLYIGEMAALLWLAVSWWQYGKSSSRIPPAPRGLTWGVTGLVGITAVGVTWAFDVALHLQLLAHLVLALAIFWGIVIWQPDKRTIMRAISLSLLLQTAVALLQFLRQDDTGLRLLGELDIAPLPGGNSILVVGAQIWLRAYGLTPHPNILGGVLTVFLLALLPPLLTTPWPQKLFWTGVWVAGSGALLVTFSRSAWLGAVIGGGYFLGILLLERAWWQYGRVLLTLLLLALLLLAGFTWWQRDLLLTRFTPQTGHNELETRSIGERQALIEHSLNLIRQNPLQGTGGNNFAIYLIPLVHRPGVAPQPVHNLPLLLTAELGIAGGLLWVWLMLFPAGYALYRLRHHQLSLWAAALTAALVGWAAIDLFDYYAWGWAQGRLLRWVYWGLWAAAMCQPERPLPTIHGNRLKNSQPGNV